MARETDQNQSFREEALPHMDAVYRFSLRLSGNPDRAEDLTQETFLKGFENWGKYTPGTKAKSWLFTICRNVFLRGEERSRRHEEIVAETADQDPRGISKEATVFMEVGDRDPDAKFWSQVVDARIVRAIDDLPAEFRDAVVLSDAEDFSYEEISEILGVPIGTVKSRIFRGRRILQKELFRYAVQEGIVKDRPSHGGLDEKGGESK